MASLADNLAHAIELARAVPVTALLAGAVAGVAVFVASYLVYRLVAYAESDAPRVVYVMAYPAPRAAPLHRSEALFDREACIETGPMSVVTVDRSLEETRHDVPPIVVEHMRPATRGTPAAALGPAGGHATTWNSAG